MYSSWDNPFFLAVSSHHWSNGISLFTSIDTPSGISGWNNSYSLGVLAILSCSKSSLICFDSYSVLDPSFFSKEL